MTVTVNQMHYDLLDAMEFTIAKGIANRSQIAIVGELFYGCGAVLFSNPRLCQAARTAATPRSSV